MNAPQWCRDPRVLWRETLRGVLLLGNDQQTRMLVNPGLIVWSLLAQPITETQLVDALSEHFEAARSQIESDVRTLLNELRDLELIQPTSDDF